MITLLPLVLTVLALIACTPAPSGAATQPTVPLSPTVSPRPPAIPAVAPPAMDFDLQFIDMMVPHHEGAIEMVGVARSRVEHPELKQLIAEMSRAQQGEINQLQRWRQQWYGSGATPPMSQMPVLDGMPPMGEAPHTMNMAVEIVRLRGAPEPFDRGFIDAMIPHHESAIEAARLAEQRAVRPEIKALAQTIVESQQREIDQLRQWRQTWFGSAEPRADSATPGTPGGPSMGPAEKPSDDPHAGEGH